MDRSNYELFDMPSRDGEKAGDANPDQGNVSLVIQPHPGGTLSKDEKQFNRLTKQIADLQRRIGERTIELDRLLEVYHARLHPLHKTSAELDLELARIIGAAARKMRFGKKQVERVRFFILDLFDAAFVHFEPDPDTKALYDSWSEVSYEDEIKESFEAMKASLLQSAKEMFGPDIDLSTFDLSQLDGSPESFARFMNQFTDQMNMKSRDDFPPERPRRKTAKQRAAEERERQEALATARNIRTLYLTLAKALHPDRAVNDDDQSRREILMRQVTAAYQDGDMTALLRLEMEWIAREDGGLRRMPEETMRSMISALKAQAKVLRDELDGLAYHPRYEALDRFAAMPMQRAMISIEREVKQFEHQIKNNRAMLRSIGAKPTKQAIMHLADAAEEAAYFEPSFEDLSMKIASGLRNRSR